VSRCLLTLAAFALCVLATASVGAQAPPTQPAPSYDVRYEVRIVPTEKTAHVAMHVTDPAHVFRSLRFRVDPERQLAFHGDGHVAVEEATVMWTPPRGGGVLHYAVRIDHLRDESSYDARCTRSFALLRGDDLVPPARVRTALHAQSRAVLQLVLPQGWSALLPYAPLSEDSWAIERPERRFDRPIGWLLLGRLGVLRERVAGTRLGIGAPVGNGMRRQDVLALLRWTLPTLRKIAPLPDRITIVGAADPMWRGGLSAPKSAYLHTSLPLIAEDGTSPVLHEIVHVLLRARAGPGGDWAVEGLAELYSLEALLRSKTISKHRYERALERIEAKGRAVKRVTVERSTAATTARAVMLLRELDQQIRRSSSGRKNLDDVVRALAEAPQPISLAHFRAVSERIAASDLAGFFDQSVLEPPD
jgi:hypothetical protein